MVQGVDRDLRVLDKAQLTGDERKQRDHAKSLFQRARQLLGDAKGTNEMDALSLATTASEEIALLVRRELKLDELMTNAERYRQGKTLAAAHALSDSLASDLDVPIRYIEDNRDRLGLDGTALADVNDKSLAALALLETDVAFLGRYDAPVRLAAVRRLLGSVNPAQLPPRFVERWYIAVAGRLQGQMKLMDTVVHVDEGVRRFPNDADILAVAGMFYELMASPSVKLPERDDRRSPTMTGPSAMPGSAAKAVNFSADADFSGDGYQRLVASKKTGLTRAADFYQRALAADSNHAEAHLRLGRILFLSARPNDAIPEFRLAAASRDPRVHYLVSMFEGAAQEAATQFDAAVASYEEAQRACPKCLSAGLALSHAQRRRGDPAAANQTLDTAIARDVQAPFADFWWNYPLGAFWQSDALMRDLQGGLR
jgi:tetratricopeptide (TPR) repeat protein